MAKINLTEIMEQAIVGKAIMTLVDEGFRVELSDQDGGGLHIYASSDGGVIPATGCRHWVRLVPGLEIDCKSIPIGLQWE